MRCTSTVRNHLARYKGSLLHSFPHQSSRNGKQSEFRPRHFSGVEPQNMDSIVMEIHQKLESRTTSPSMTIA